MNNSELARIFALYSNRDIKEGDWYQVKDMNKEIKLYTIMDVGVIHKSWMRLIPTDTDLLNVMRGDGVNFSLIHGAITLLKGNMIHDIIIKGDLSKAIQEAFLYLHNNKHLEVLK